MPVNTSGTSKVRAKSFKVVRDLPDVYLPPPPANKGTQAWKIWAKEGFVELLRNNFSITDACNFLGVSRGWYEKNCDRDEEFKVLTRLIRDGTDPDIDEQGRDWPDISWMPYHQFAEEYLGLKVFPHQKPIVDAIEDPMINKTIVTGFPESGKSTHASLGYVLYKLCVNPDARIALVSKSGQKSKDLLRRVKRYMTEEHLYDHTQRNLIKDFKGFRPGAHTAHPWDAEQITIRQRRSGERDPSIQALGVGAQIYGARLDLLLLDDALTLENQLTEKRRASIDSWFLQEAASRAHKGEIIVVGTRVHPMDNFKSWMEAWADDPHAAFVKIPAITTDENGEEQSTWPEYWPLKGALLFDEFENRERYQKGLLDIRKEMESMGAWRWRLVYQQEDVSNDSTIFSKEAIDRALELGKDRMLGQVRPHEILVLGIDPAITGRAAAVLMAYDPRSRVRTIVDLFVGDGLGATGVRNKLMYEFWERYHPQRTLIEVNYAPTIMGDDVLKTRARAAGSLLLPHTTYGAGRKRGSINDEEYGIAALAPLLSGGLWAFPSATPQDLRKLEPLLDDLQGFPYSDQKDALVGMWICEGEVPMLEVSAPSIDNVIRARNLPPKLARRLKRVPA
jgi:hypothetical protein